MQNAKIAPNFGKEAEAQETRRIPAAVKHVPSCAHSTLQMAKGLPQLKHLLLPQSLPASSRHCSLFAVAHPPPESPPAEQLQSFECLRLAQLEGTHFHRYGAWLPAQFQQKMDFVKPAKTMPSISRTTKQNILKLIGFAIKRYAEHAMQLILHKLGQELNVKALGYFLK